MNYTVRSMPADNVIDGKPNFSIETPFIPILCFQPELADSSSRFTNNASSIPYHKSLTYLLTFAFPAISSNFDLTFYLQVPGILIHTPPADNGNIFFLVYLIENNK